MSAPPRGILFVCLGNICRSPTAEYVARAEFARAGIDLDVASAGLGDWHIGQGADPRTIAAAREAGFDLSPHRARQFDDNDFARYARILAMDRATLRALRTRTSAHGATPELFLDAAGFANVDTQGDVPDPYSGGIEDFRNALALIRAGVAGLTQRLRPASCDDRARQAGDG